MLTGTPLTTGVLTGAWTKLGLNCTKTVDVVKGNATFTLPQTAIIVSINDGTPLVDLQGVVDNTSNQFTISIPYTGGAGTYDAYEGIYVSNDEVDGEGGDVNSFRLTYPSGIFSASGSITATIEVDGDGSFNAKKQLFGVQKTIAVLDFQVNGHSKGDVNLDVIGGIPDRNFADPDHKFVYFPVTADDGNVWLNNNLGANYSNMNHVQFNPAQQATAYNDYHAYGSLFQWGRYSDGHELVNYTDGNTGVSVYGTTTTNATSDTPGHNLYISETSSPSDWRVPQNDNLWQGESGINNPCPQGYRLATRSEMNTLVSAENITNRSSAFTSSLALTAAGNQHPSSGLIQGQGSICEYSTSTVDGVNFKMRYIDGSFTVDANSSRVSCMPVRCIKD